MCACVYVCVRHCSCDGSTCIHTHTNTHIHTCIYTHTLGVDPSQEQWLLIAEVRAKCVSVLQCVAVCCSG